MVIFLDGIGENVCYVKGYFNTITLGILAGDLNRFGGDIDACHLPLRVGFLESDRDTTASCSYVQDTAIGNW